MKIRYYREPTFRAEEIINNKTEKFTKAILDEFFETDINSISEERAKQIREKLKGGLIGDMIEYEDNKFYYIYQVKVKTKKSVFLLDVEGDLWFFTIDTRVIRGI